MNKLSKAGQDLLIDGILATTTIGCATAIVAGDSMLPNSALIGFGCTAGLTWLTRRWPKSNTSRRPKFAEMSSITPTFSADPDYRSFTMKWKPEPKPAEFVFAGLGLPVAIVEAKFQRFVRLAIQRQRNALYGNKLNMFRVNGNYRQIKPNWILSETYFTNDLSRPFCRDEYFSILIILGYTRLIIGDRRQGTSGRLGDGWEQGVSGFVEIAKERWMRLSSASPAPRRNLFNIFSFARA